MHRDDSHAIGNSDPPLNRFPVFAYRLPFLPEDLAFEWSPILLLDGVGFTLSSTTDEIADNLHNTAMSNIQRLQSMCGRTPI